MSDTIDRYFLRREIENIEVPTNTLNVQWNNLLSIDRLNRMIALLGRNPDAIYRARGGFAIWTDILLNGLYKFKEIRISDVDSYDSIFITYNYAIKPSKICNLHKVSYNIIYYPKGRTLTVVCSNLGISLATFFAIKQYNNDEIGYEDAKDRINELSNDIQQEYNENDSFWDLELTNIIAKYLFDVRQKEEIVVERPSIERISSYPVIERVRPTSDISLRESLLIGSNGKSAV